MARWALGTTVGMRIICDFDGTITPQDTTDRVLEALADPAWRELEAQWVAAEITASECMRRQIALIGGGRRLLQRDDGLGFPA